MPVTGGQKSGDRKGNFAPSVDDAIVMQSSFTKVIQIKKNGSNWDITNVTDGGATVTVADGTLYKIPFCSTGFTINDDDGVLKISIPEATGFTVKAVFGTDRPYRVTYIYLDSNTTATDILICG